MSGDTSFERDTERLKLDLRPFGQLERYSDARISHTDSEGIDATATWLETERTSFNLHTRLQDASTLYSELTSTGIIRLGQRRRDEAVDGGWTFQQTERWTLQLGGSFSSSNYHGASISSLSNYRQALGTASESYAFTERFSVMLTGSAGNAHTGGVEQSTRFDSLGLGFQWQPSERLSIQGSGGGSRQTTNSLTSTTAIGQLSLSYSTELSRFALSAQRQVQPSGFGVFTQVDQASLTATRDLAPRLSLGAEADIFRNTSAFQSPFISFTFAERTYSEAHLQLSLQQTPAWTLSALLLYDRADSPSSFLFVPGLHARGWNVSLQSAWAPLGASTTR